MNSNAWKVLAFSLLLCWIGMPQGIADVVVPISVSQQVSVSGGVNACDPGCEMLTGIQHNSSNFSSANANTLLPPTNLFQDGSTTDSLQINPFYIRTAWVDASASQTFTLAPTSFNLGLSVNGELTGTADLMFGAVSADSQYSLVFDLTSPYVVHLTGGIGGNSYGYFAGLDGLFDGEIHLTGPGLQFDQVLSFPIYTDNFYGQSFDQTFTLGPGQYTLDAVSTLDGDGSYYLDSNSFLDLSLNADFTPAIPEPARVSTALGVLMVIGIFFARRHGQNRLSV